LTDQINFSTINLNIYEKQAVKRELVANEINIDEYEPDFGQKIVESLVYGWDILGAFLVFLARLWGIILFSIVAYFVYKTYRHKLK
jgi:hypothetical protein